jgi:hypothetical protein
MDQATIEIIATEIAKHLPSHLWLPLLIQVLIMVLAAGVGAFVGEYLKTRGQHLATKADFESLQSQLRAQTELVESVKAEVGQKDWAKREWTNVRRTKLEALITAMHDSEAYVQQHLYASIQGKFFGDRDRLNELQSIADLYLPELRPEVSGFTTACREQIVSSANLGQQVASADAHRDRDARQRLIDEYHAQLNISSMLKASSALTDAARKLLLKIMDVDQSLGAAC